MEMFSLWYELGMKAKQLEIQWNIKRLADFPPAHALRIAFIEQEVFVFRQIHLHFNEGDIFIAYGRLERLERIVRDI
jgi:hypothetical protein